MAIYVHNYFILMRICNCWTSAFFYHNAQVSERQCCLDTRLLFLKHKCKALSSFVIYFSIFIIVPLRSPTYILAFKPKLRDVASSYDELLLVVVAVLAKQLSMDHSELCLQFFYSYFSLALFIFCYPEMMTMTAGCDTLALLVRLSWFLNHASDAVCSE